MEIESGRTHLTLHEAHATQALTVEFNRNALWRVVDTAVENWFGKVSRQTSEPVPAHPIEVALTDAQLEEIRQLGVRVLQHTQRRIEALAAVFSELDIDGAEDSDGLISKLRQQLVPSFDTAITDEPEPDSTQLLGAMIMTIDAYQAASGTVARNTA